MVKSGLPRVYSPCEALTCRTEPRGRRESVNSFRNKAADAGALPQSLSLRPCSASLNSPSDRTPAGRPAPTLGAGRSGHV
eukprot:4378713-Prymnesium_polylepis.1